MNRLNLDRKTTVCFTGHRPKDIILDNPYDESNRPKYQKLVDAIAEQVTKLVEQGYVNFISGGAQGMDQLAFWAVNNVKRSHPHIQNIVYMPFRGQESRWAKTGLFSQHEYNLMLKRADHVYVCNEEITGGDRFPVIAKALMDRNEDMVQDSSYVMALCNHEDWMSPTTKGGTAACMKYAKKHGRPIAIIKYQA